MSVHPEGPCAGLPDCPHCVDAADEARIAEWEGEACRCPLGPDNPYCPVHGPLEPLPEPGEVQHCPSCGRLKSEHVDGWGRYEACVEQIGDTLAFHEEKGL